MTSDEAEIDIVAGLKPAIKKYLEIRTHIAARTKDLDAELAEFNAAAKQLSAYISAALTQNGLKNVKTDDGTAYTVTTSSYRIADGAAYLRWLTENQMWESVDLKPIANATDAIAEERFEAWLEDVTLRPDEPRPTFEQFLPPGLTRTTAVSLRVRTK